MSRRALLRERTTRHGLAHRPATTAEAATRLTTAVQAQDAPASHLGLRARASGLTEAGVRHALDVERTIVRTWLMRGTIHLVTATDLRWLVRLVGPAVARRYATRWRELGLTDDVRTQVARALPEILQDGPVARPQILAALAERGLGGTTGPLHGHALVQASVDGLICRGPDGAAGARTVTFALTDDWVPGPPAGPSGDDALAELARRYFAAYSPATVADFATWSGLAGARAVALIRDELTETEVDGRPGFRLGEVEAQRGTRLLPAFDNYVLGYADRSAVVDIAHHGAVYRGGMIRPTVVVDGRVVGTWSLQRARSTLVVASFAGLTDRARREVQREARDIGRFVGLDLDVSVK